MTGEEEWFCSATAAVLRWIFLEIERVAGQTPPVSSGETAAQFPQFSEDVKHQVMPIVPSLPKNGR